jgi:26S proteasome regulatory subunit N5
MQIASDLLSDLQVETYSSMERLEKTEFLIEQMRLLVAVAKLKDKAAGKETLADGEAEWVKVRVGGRKVNEGFLAADGNEVRALLFRISSRTAVHGVGFRTSS